MKPGGRTAPSPLFLGPPPWTARITHGCPFYPMSFHARLYPRTCSRTTTPALTRGFRTSLGVSAIRFRDPLFGKGCLFRKVFWLPDNSTRGAFPVLKSRPVAAGPAVRVSAECTGIAFSRQQCEAGSRPFSSPVTAAGLPPNHTGFPTRNNRI